MTKFPLGALLDDKYVLPYNAEKGVGYRCPGCNESVIIRKGNIKKHHFAHKPDSKCKFYNHPGEGEIHKMTKYIIADLLKKRKINNIRLDNCLVCSSGHRNNMIVYEDGDEVFIEHRVHDKCIVDIAIINNGKLKYIFEICDTHKTTRETPEPWFEIDAKKFLKDTHNGTDLLKIQKELTDVQIMDKVDILQELYDHGLNIKGTLKEVRLRLKKYRTSGENKIVRCMRKGYCRNCKEDMSNFTVESNDTCERILSVKNKIIQSTEYVECYPDIGKIYSIRDCKGTLEVEIDGLKFKRCDIYTRFKFIYMLWDIWKEHGEYDLTIIDNRNDSYVYYIEKRHRIIDDPNFDDDDCW